MILCAEDFVLTHVHYKRTFGNTQEREDMHKAAAERLKLLARKSAEVLNAPPHPGIGLSQNPRKPLKNKQKPRFCESPFAARRAAFDDATRRINNILAELTSIGTAR